MDTLPSLLMRTVSLLLFVNAIVSARGLSIKVFGSLAKPNTLSAATRICSDDVQESVASTQFQVLFPCVLSTVIPAPSTAASFP